MFPSRRHLLNCHSHHVIVAVVKEYDRSIIIMELHWLEYKISVIISYDLIAMKAALITCMDSVCL